MNHWQLRDLIMHNLLITGLHSFARIKNRQVETTKSGMFSEERQSFFWENVESHKLSRGRKWARLVRQSLMIAVDYLLMGMTHSQCKLYEVLKLYFHLR